MSIIYLECVETCLLVSPDNYLLPLHADIKAGQTVKARKVLNVPGSGVEAGSVPGATHPAPAQAAKEVNIHP